MTRSAAVSQLKRFLHFILFGNIYVALGTAGLVQSSVRQLGLSDPLYAYSLLTFFATLFIYNLQRIFYRPQADISLHSIRRKWIFEHQGIIKLLTGAGFAGTTITFFMNDPVILLYLSPLLLLSVAYFIPSVRLRKSPWLKLLTLVIVWTTVTAVVPALLSDTTPRPAETLLHIATRFVFMAAICIPFDIRDLHIDKADTISTLPQLLGERSTRNAAVLCSFLYILLVITEYLAGMFNAAVLGGLLSSAAITALLVVISSSKRNEYFYVAGLDGTMILQGLLLVLATGNLF